MGGERKDKTSEQEKTITQPVKLLRQEIMSIFLILLALK